MAKKEKRKGGKSPKIITISLKRTDGVWYAILQYRTLNANTFLRRKLFPQQQKFYSPHIEKLQPYIMAKKNHSG